MPNFDAGTYFLTILAPVRLGTVQDSTGPAPGSWDEKFTKALAKTSAEGVASYELGDVARGSWAQRLRAVLATLPTALQSPATIDIGVQSPFARNTRNHLCRFALIENPMYNGRSAANPIVNALRGLPFVGRFFGRYEDPLVPQHVDNLTTPYLMFATDFDAITQDGAALPAVLSKDEQDQVRDSYLRKLWETAEEEIRAVFENCVGFENVNDAEGFVNYMVKRQVETTMPFHDYWIEKPDIEKLPVPILAAIVLVPAVVFLFAALCWLVGYLCWLLGCDTLFFARNSGLTAAVAFLLTIPALAVAYKWVIRHGNKPFPPAKYGDLPTVLKALYLQQNFADFVIANQGATSADLHGAFGDFIGKHKPQNRDGPTQKPGYINSSEADAVQQ